jgi:hypothetical protein
LFKAMLSVAAQPAPVLPEPFPVSGIEAAEVFLGFPEHAGMVADESHVRFHPVHRSSGHI